jgi:hypothetical protein
MKMDLDEILNSKVRRKIIRILCKVGSTNMMNLVRLTNSTYNQVNPSILTFGKEGIVTEQRYGRVRMITLERENPKTRLLLQALKILNSENTPTKKTASSLGKNKLESQARNSSSSTEHPFSLFFQEKRAPKEPGSDDGES